jgi:hypothetical protein
MKIHVNGIGFRPSNLSLGNFSRASLDKKNKLISDFADGIHSCFFGSLTAARKVLGLPGSDVSMALSTRCAIRVLLLVRVPGTSFSIKTGLSIPSFYNSLSNVVDLCFCCSSTISSAFSVIVRSIGGSST